MSPEGKIAADVSVWAKNVAKEKLVRYARNYPKTVVGIVKNVVT